MIATGPLQSLALLFRAIWEGLFLGSVAGAKRLGSWFVSGTWTSITTKVLVGFMAIVAFRSLWMRMADASDPKPLRAMGSLVFLLFLGLMAIVSNSSGFWTTFARLVIP